MILLPFLYFIFLFFATKGLGESRKHLGGGNWGGGGDAPEPKSILARMQKEGGIEEEP